MAAVPDIAPPFHEDDRLPQADNTCDIFSEHARLHKLFSISLSPEPSRVPIYALVIEAMT